MFGKTFPIAAALIVAGIWLFAGSEVSAGEKWQDNMGITVDANNYNSDLIRRSQNRRRRDVNRLNSIPRRLYETAAGGHNAADCCPVH